MQLLLNEINCDTDFLESLFSLLVFKSQASGSNSIYDTYLSTKEKQFFEQKTIDIYCSRLALVWFYPLLSKNRFKKVKNMDD